MPMMYKNYQALQNEKNEARKGKIREKLSASLSRTWVCLSLNNSVISGLYATIRGDLADSLLGCASGIPHNSNTF